MTICLRTRRWPSRRQALRSCVYFLAMVSSPRCRAASSHRFLPHVLSSGSPSRRVRHRAAARVCLSVIVFCIISLQPWNDARFCRARGRGAPSVRNVGRAAQRRLAALEWDCAERLPRSGDRRARWGAGRRAWRPACGSAPGPPLAAASDPPRWAARLGGRAASRLAAAGAAVPQALAISRIGIAPFGERGMRCMGAGMRRYPRRMHLTAWQRFSTAPRARVCSM